MNIKSCLFFITLFFFVIEFSAARKKKTQPKTKFSVPIKKKVLYKTPQKKQNKKLSPHSDDNKTATNKKKQKSVNQAQADIANDKNYKEKYLEKSKFNQITVQGYGFCGGEKVQSFTTIVRQSIVADAKYSFKQKKTNKKVIFSHLKHYMPKDSISSVKFSIGTGNMNVDQPVEIEIVPMYKNKKCSKPIYHKPIRLNKNQKVIRLDVCDFDKGRCGERPDIARPENEKNSNKIKKDLKQNNGLQTEKKKAKKSKKGENQGGNHSAKEVDEVHDGKHKDRKKAKEKDNKDKDKQSQNLKTQKSFKSKEKIIKEGKNKKENKNEAKDETYGLQDKKEEKKDDQKGKNQESAEKPGDKEDVDKRKIKKEKKEIEGQNNNINEKEKNGQGKNKKKQTKDGVKNKKLQRNDKLVSVYGFCAFQTNHLQSFIITLKQDVEAEAKQSKKNKKLGKNGKNILLGKALLDMSKPAFITIEPKYKGLAAGKCNKKIVKMIKPHEIKSNAIHLGVCDFKKHHCDGDDQEKDGNAENSKNKKQKGKKKKTLVKIKGYGFCPNSSEHSFTITVSQGGEAVLKLREGKSLVDTSNRLSKNVRRVKRKAEKKELKNKVRNKNKNDDENLGFFTGSANFDTGVGASDILIKLDPQFANSDHCGKEIYEKIPADNLKDVINLGQCNFEKSDCKKI